MTTTSYGFSIGTLALALCACATEHGAAQGGTLQPGPTAVSSSSPVKLHGPKKRIGVVDFEDSSRHHGWSGSRNALAAAARDVATEMLVQSGAFVVVEREQIAQVLKEQGFGMSGALSPQSAAKAGKLLGLQAIVTGKITDFDTAQTQSGFGVYYMKNSNTFHARVSLRMIDTTTGEVWLAESGEGQAEETSTVVLGAGAATEDQTLGKQALYAAIHQMLNKVLAKADSKAWSGSIAKVSKDGKVYITAGSDIGLPIGASLTVHRLGDEITDPSTGQVLGHEIGRVVGKLHVADHLNEKVSVCLSAKGSGYSPGDVVTLDATQVAAAD